jgi:ATP-binding cassette subfamily B protein
MIRLEGDLLQEYTLASVRNAVCYTPQHPVLFAGTVRENLLYGDPTASTDDLLKVLRAVQFGSVLAKLPHGLDTPLGPGACRLSGGERQKLAIARSLLRKAAVLVLDESTSNLDAATEQVVFASVADFNPGQTLIIISHRIISLTWVDRFLVLDRGRIVESGSHSKLYAQSGLYRTLFDVSVQEAALRFH